MTQVTFGEATYEIGKLNAKQQFHASKRVAPLIGVLGDVWPDISAMAAAEEKGDEATYSEQDVFRVVGKLAEGIAAIPEKDADAVIDICLSAVRRSNKGGTGFSPVLASNGALMFQDMDMPEMLFLVWQVLQRNMGNFTSAFRLPSKLEAEVARRVAGIHSQAETTGF